VAVKTIVDNNIPSAIRDNSEKSATVNNNAAQRIILKTDPKKKAFTLPEGMIFKFTASTATTPKLSADLIYPLVCEIVETDVQYADLSEALAVVADGETIKLLDNAVRQAMIRKKVVVNPNRT